MKHWHYTRIKIPFAIEEFPHETPAGNWIFFWISYVHDARKTPFRETRFPMHTLGLDGVDD